MCKNGVKCHLSHSSCGTFNLCLCACVGAGKKKAPETARYILSIYGPVCEHLHRYDHKHICIQPHTFPCWSVQPVTAQGTGLLSGNEKHMCSRRPKLLQSHLLLAKHFHPLLNISVHFLSACSPSLCAVRMIVYNVWVLMCSLHHPCLFSFPFLSLPWGRWEQFVPPQTTSSIWT